MTENISDSFDLPRKTVRDLSDVSNETGELF
jgi:hypothetical protein